MSSAPTSASRYPIHSLLPEHVPRLAEIRPGFTAHSTLLIRRTGAPPFQSWQLEEVPLHQAFEKGNSYDFDAIEQANIRRRLAQPNTLIEVVADPYTQRLLGILDVEEESWRQSAWVWNLMLDSSVRRQGLGRLLMERCLAWARARNLRAVLLETQSNNLPACHFYARLGFRLIGVNEMFYTNNDIERGEVALFWGYSLR
ncbi:MAG: GNAT family N-acetyltransferase [Anaerolineae bacterium]|nr:GNAT family N-acetyltransferase [Anaerolineae bacterium]